MGFRFAPKSMTLDELELDRGRPPLYSNTALKLAYLRLHTTQRHDIGF